MVMLRKYHNTDYRNDNEIIFQNKDNRNWCLTYEETIILKDNLKY